MIYSKVSIGLAVIVKHFKWLLLYNQEEVVVKHNNRSNLLKASLLLILILIASGCVPVAAEPVTNASTQAEVAEPATPSPAGSTVEKELEIVSPWTSGGENAALMALVDLWQQENPGAEFVNAAVGGGGGDAARPVLQTRLQGGNPPDVWQAHAGQELFGDYVIPSYAGDVSAIYESEGWLDVAPPALIDVLKTGDGIYGVTAGVHRTNMVWYNKKVLEANGFQIGQSVTLDEFFRMLDELKAAGMAPLCVGDKEPWPSAQIFEDTLSGLLPAEKYRGLWNGQTAWDDPDVQKAVEAYGRLLDYQNDDHAALSWDQAIKKVQEGKCVFSAMGDWSYGEFLKAGLKDNEDFGWFAFPGADNVFVVNNDIFVQPPDPQHPNLTRSFMQIAGSQEGQIAFNKLKGSIPWRTDVDKSSFPPYQQEAIEVYAKAELVPTVVHGLAAPAPFRQALMEAVTLFSADRDPGKFIQALVDASKS